MSKLFRSIIASMSVLFIGAQAISPVFAARPASDRAVRQDTDRRATNSSDLQPTRKQGRINSCESRIEGIRQRSRMLTQTATTMMEKFQSITQRVEDYYTTKVVPSGMTVENYDELVAAIAAKQAAAQSAVSQATADIEGFSCTDADPRTVMNRYRVHMQEAKKALQEYRTAIRNLIVAIHSVTGTDEAPTRSVRPTRAQVQKRIGL